MRCAITMLALIGLSSSAWSTGPLTRRGANIQLARGDVSHCYRLYLIRKQSCTGKADDLKECRAGWRKGSNGASSMVQNGDRWLTAGYG